MSPFNRVRAEGDFRKLQRGYEWKAGKWQKIKDPARASYAKNIFDGQKKGRGWAKEKKLALFSAGASALLAGVAVVGSPLGGSVGSAFFAYEAGKSTKNLLKIRGTSKRQAVLMSSARGIKLSPTLKKVYGLDRGKAVLVGVKGGTATGAKVVPFSSKGQGPRFGREPIGRISSYNGSYGSSRGGGFLRSAGSWLKSKLGR